MSKLLPDRVASNREAECADGGRGATCVPEKET